MPFHEMSLRDAKRMWIAVGGSVDDKNGTGEEVYRHPELIKPITVNKRRDDAPRKLTVALNRLWKKQAA